MTPVCVLRDQFVQILNKYSANHACVLRLDKHAKLKLTEEWQLPTIVVLTQAMFRRVIGSLPTDFIDIVFLDECQNMTDRDWNLVNKLKSTLIAITSIHPLTISKKVFASLGKQTPDYSYGISSIRLKDLANIQIGVNYSKKQLLSKGKWRFVRPRDIKKNGFLECNTFISEDVAKKKTRGLLKVGDIVLQNIFNFGKMAIVRKEDLPAIASQNLFIIRSKTISPDILFEYLQSKAIVESFHQQLRDLAYGSTIKHISLRDVDEIPVPLPFSKKQIIEFGTIKRMQDIRDLKKARNELAHLRNAYKQFSGTEE